MSFLKRRILQCKFSLGWQSLLNTQDAKVLLVVLFYMSTSITMVMLNKAILNSTRLPLSFLWLQILVAVGLLHFLALFGWIRLPVLNRDTVSKLIPMGLVNAVGLSANTYCLANVDASLFQVRNSFLSIQAISGRLIVL